MQFTEFFIPARVTTAAILLAAVALAAVSGLWLSLLPVAVVGEGRVFTVEPGWGSRRIASELEDAGLIRWAPSFVVVAHWSGVSGSLKAGSYLLSPDMSARDILGILSRGEALIDDIVLTVPEGMNVWEIDALLQRRGLIVPGSFARTWQDEEGTLWPDTYRLDRSLADRVSEFSNAKTIGDTMRSAFDARAATYTPEQVIVASILEKEAKSPEDMALVAGIIAKRRELGMPLQIDATVAYGWCLRRWLPMSSTANCDVTQAPLAAEIKIDGLYNTYTRLGLPKGPISNPGLKALEAAKNPKVSEYLFYLSTRDGSRLIYSKTLEEHNRNRAIYLDL